MNAGKLLVFVRQPDAFDEHKTDTSSLRLEGGQETLDGGEVIEGEAADISSKDVDGVDILEDGTIEDADHSVAVHKRNEWLGVPDAETPYALVDSSDAKYLHTLLTISTGADVEEAEIDVNGVLGALAEEDLSVWEYGYRGEDENSETGVIYPGAGEGGEVLVSKLQGRELTMLGFRYEQSGEYYKGELARSGYLHLSSPDVDHAQFVGWVNDVVLPHVYIPEDDDE